MHAQAQVAQLVTDLVDVFCFHGGVLSLIKFEMK